MPTTPVSTRGSEDHYIQAHGAFGPGLNQIGGRSMMSFTTQPEGAAYFAGEEGAGFTAQVPQSGIIHQSLEGAGESEVLIRHMVPVTPT